ncbi:amidohydrolase family protein [Bryobacter aggregatus]|uniref:amidohydrolase family protein n=1 Tax=Bryobacter aggregatus TaxID=360054 RepID=UPI0004E0DA1D|nr:amidohydrolase family protein [Bryobacter aggregatus]
MLWTRRTLLATPLALAAQAKGPLVDTHIHLFADDKKSFPKHPNGTYTPPPAPLESYVKFVKQAGIAHAIIVHPEPYQDDHRYLEYCFRNEPSKDFFKGTCLFDACRADTPKRIDDLMQRWPGRIRALRVHRTNLEALETGAIHDRPLDSPQMLKTWQAVADRGLAIQMHFIPAFAKQINALATKVPKAPVILDHLGRSGMGTEAEWQDILALAKQPQTVMKFSGINYSSKQPWPYRDVQPRVRQAFQAFGPDRIIWGGLGMNQDEFRKANQLFDEFFAFTTEANRDKIRGGNALRIYGWKS